MGVTRHQKENNLRIGSLKFKLQGCRKSEVLVSFFDGNIVRDIVYTWIVSLLKNMLLRFICLSEISSFGFFKRINVGIIVREF